MLHPTWVIGFWFGGFRAIISVNYRNVPYEPSISRSKYNAHRSPLSKHMEILSVNNMLHQKALTFHYKHVNKNLPYHNGDVIMGAITSQITSLTSVYSTVYLDANQRKLQSSASLAFVRGIHRGPVNSPHNWPVTRKMFPFNDVIMITLIPLTSQRKDRFTTTILDNAIICAWTELESKWLTSA